MYREMLLQRHVGEMPHTVKHSVLYVREDVDKVVIGHQAESVSLRRGTYLLAKIDLTWFLDNELVSSLLYDLTLKLSPVFQDLQRPAGL